MKKIFFCALMGALTSLSGQSFYNQLLIPPAYTGTNFILTVADTSHHFFGTVNTPTSAVNGSYLGPTLIVNKDDSVNIAVVNNLTQSTTMHWHGMHVPAEMDGGPHTVIPAGTTWNVGFNIRNAASTNWYHPHLHMNTGQQVNNGIAGMLIVNDTVESQLNLPRTYGIDDIPVVLQDRSFDSNANFIFDGLSDSMVVNGTMHAYLDAPAQIVRLRLLNGSNVRSYNIGFSDNRTFYVIASDGGLLNQPYATTRLKISSGERYEILLDLTADFGNSFTMMSYAASFSNTEPGGGGMPNGTSPLNAVNFDIMQINVTAATANPVTSVPATLIANNPWLAANANTIRYKTIDGNGMFATMANFTFNNQAFDMMVINDTVPLNNVEIWHFTNNSNIAHPIHIHDIQFFVLSRNGNQPPAYEEGLKDVFYIMPNEAVQVITKFEDFTTDTVPYMYHCHNLVHEDNGMMGQFVVMDTTTSISESGVIDFSVYPNPTATTVDLIFSSGHTGSVNIQITDANGNVVRNSVINLSPVNSTVPVDMSGYAAGVYFISITTNNSSRSIKVVKE